MSEQRTILRRWIRRVTVFLFCCMLSVTLAFMSAVAAVALHFDGSSVLPADCAVVFGAAVYGSRPGPAIVRRVGTAVGLYHQGQVKKLFLTGGKVDDSADLPEADVMAEEAMRHGVNASDITREAQSRSTWENLLFTRPLTADCQSVIAVSDRFHLARITLLARLQGWGSLRTHPSVSRPTPLLEHRSIIREALGYLYYVSRTHHWITLDPARKRARQWVEPL